MDSVVPTPTDMKRLKKLMRKLSVVEDQNPSMKHPTPRQQKKIDKAFRKIIKETDASLGSPVH
jgi:hypothetical protein